ncbi:MAG: MaoC family dehydratase [Actinomycetota bacterium]|nr:MaoC family dehydratase [Actinomycetota bacterium]MDA2972276.1 MaoC family dehydratase [Actinomycetota bacterium]MDA3001397.1 MaoC family dehydratase [Actinomycetota bacterium]
MTATKLPDTRTFASVNVGDVLPSLDLPLTRTLIVSTAIATRDYQVVHHDPDVAKERGSQDIIMNILTSNSFVGRFVTDWTGPNAILRSVKIRLGAPNYPGDTMVITGEVTSVDPGERLVTVAVKGSNSLGDHMNATVEVVLP